MSRCGGIRVRVLGTGVPLGLEMDPHLDVAPPLMGMSAILVLGMDPTLEVTPPIPLRFSHEVGPLCP